MLNTDQHRELAHRLNDPRVVMLAHLVMRHTGKSSRASAQAERLLDAMGKLRAELEAVLAVDHPHVDHTGIFYPQT